MKLKIKDFLPNTREVAKGFAVLMFNSPSKSTLRLKLHYNPKVQECDTTRDAIKCNCW